MEMMMRTKITTEAALPPLCGTGVTVGGSEEILLGCPEFHVVVGTAETGEKTVQTRLLSFTVGIWPAGHEQTVLPSFKIDLKVSGQTQEAVDGLKEEN